MSVRFRRGCTDVLRPDGEIERGCALEWATGGALFHHAVVPEPGFAKGPFDVGLYDGSMPAFLTIGRDVAPRSASAGVGEGGMRAFKDEVVALLAEQRALGDAIRGDPIRGDAIRAR